MYANSLKFGSSGGREIVKRTFRILLAFQAFILVKDVQVSIGPRLLDVVDEEKSGSVTYSISAGLIVWCAAERYREEKLIFFYWPIPANDVEDFAAFRRFYDSTSLS